MAGGIFFTYKALPESYLHPSHEHKSPVFKPILFDADFWNIMADFPTSRNTLPHIPDNQTLAQFMLDYQHEIRPTRGNFPCLIDDGSGRQIDFKTLRSETQELASALYTHYKIGEDDTVMILSPNHINYPVALWAVHRLGGIVTCSNPQFKVDELAYQLQLAKVTFMIVHSTVLDLALEAALSISLPTDRIILLDRDSSLLQIPEIQLSVPELITIGKQEPQMFCEPPLRVGEGKEKIGLLCWSSGTTGKPKAVAISHCALIANIIQMASHNQVAERLLNGESRSYRPGDVALGILPFFHSAGLVIGLHLVVFCAMTLVVPPKFESFPALLRSISCHQISHLFLVPPHAITFCKHPDVLEHDLSKVKYVMIGAAPVSSEIQERLYEIFPLAQIGQAYGLSETTCTLSMISALQRRGPVGSGGRLLPGIQAMVIKRDGSLAKYGEPGELVVKSPATALGYLDNVEATRETFKDGWVYTGDEVILTSDHEIFVLDRLKELLKVRGFQVAPAELEGCLLSHPNVADACVVGIPDDYSGEAPLAFVVLTATAADRIARNPSLVGYMKESLIKHVKSRKASYKRLAGGVQFVDSIPRNGSGKIMRRILREEARRHMQLQDVRSHVSAKL